MVEFGLLVLLTFLLVMVMLVLCVALVFHKEVRRAISLIRYQRKVQRYQTQLLNQKYRATHRMGMADSIMAQYEIRLRRVESHTVTVPQVNSVVKPAARIRESQQKIVETQASYVGALERVAA